MNTPSTQVLSIIGNIGAGKSTTILALCERLKAKGIPVLSLAIDEERRAIWDVGGRGEWDINDEDNAYGELLLKTFTAAPGTIVIIETVGLAKRMRQIHGRISQQLPLSIIKLECRPDICRNRHSTRNRNFADYPALPIEGTIEDGIEQLAEAVEDMRADLTLRTDSQSAEQNAQQIAEWILQRNIGFQAPPKQKQDPEPCEYVKEIHRSTANTLGEMDVHEMTVEMLNDNSLKPNTGLIVYEAASYSANYGLPLSPSSFDELSKMVESGGLCRVSAALAAREMKRLFGETLYPSIGVDLLRSVGALSYDIPELGQLYHHERNGNGPWTRTLQRIDRAAARVQMMENVSSGRRIALVLAALFYELAEIHSDRLFELLERVTGVLLLEDKIYHRLATALLLRKEATQFIKYLNEDAVKPAAPAPAQKPPPRRVGMGPVRGMVPVSANRNAPEQEQRKRAVQFFAKMFPLSLEEYFLFIETCDLNLKASEQSPQRKILTDVVKKYKIDLTQSQPLVTKDDLVKTLNVPGGPHVGRILGQIETRRSELITRQRALDYLAKNLKRFAGPELNLAREHPPTQQLTPPKPTQKTDRFQLRR